MNYFFQQYFTQFFYNLILCQIPQTNYYLLFSKIIIDWAITEIRKLFTDFCMLYINQYMKVIVSVFILAQILSFSSASQDPCLNYTNFIFYQVCEQCASGYFLYFGYCQPCTPGIQQDSCQSAAENSATQQTNPENTLTVAQNQSYQDPFASFLFQIFPTSSGSSSYFEAFNSFTGSSITNLMPSLSTSTLQSQIGPAYYDEYCIRPSIDWQCLECIQGYKVNVQNGYCQVQKTTEKTLPNCIIIQQETNTCAQCDIENNYIRTSEGLCTLVSQQEVTVYLSEISSQSNTQTTKTTSAETISIRSSVQQVPIIQKLDSKTLSAVDISSGQAPKINLQTKKSEQLFIVDEKFLNIGQNLKVQGITINQDTTGTQCKTFSQEQNKCLQCNQGYIVNALLKSECIKINDPLVLLDISQIDLPVAQTQQEPETVSPETTQTTQTTRPADPNCRQPNPDLTSNVYCLECAYYYDYYASTKKCEYLDQNCDFFNFQNHTCDSCFYGTQLDENGFCIASSRNLFSWWG